MKNALLVVMAFLPLAIAVPTEINYQGVLTDQNGNPINGARAMQIKIYDAPTGGTLLYSEDLGNVPVQDGIYSFSFGANGTSNALTTETIAIANGTVSTFQKVLSAPTVVAGSVTVTDGTYTWDQTNGSSNENDFGVSYSSSLRRATVNYYNGTPAAGKIISATYRAPSGGISGALAESNQPWLETTVNGTAQSHRQKILTVPFSAKSAHSISTDTISSPPFGILLQPYNSFATAAPPYTGVSGAPFSWEMFSTRIYIPIGINKLKIKLPIAWSTYYVWENLTYLIKIQVKIGNIVIASSTINGQKGGANEVMSCDIETTINPSQLQVPTGFQDFKVEATLSNYPIPNGNYGRIIGGSASPWLIIDNSSN